MRHWLFAFLSLLLGYAAHGQPIPTDSLQRVFNSLRPLGENQHDDTLRIKTLMAWAETIQDDNEAIRLWGQVLSLSEASEWAKGQLIANSKLGVYYGRRGQFYNACDYLFAGLYLAEKAKDTYYTGYILHFLGDFHLNLHEYKKAIGYYQKALPVLRQANNQYRYLLCQNNMGLVYYELKQYDAAIQQFAACQKANQSLQDKNITSYCLINMAASYRQKKLYKEALQYIARFQKLNTNNIDDLAFANAQIARIYLMMNQPTTALQYARSAYAMRDRVMGTTLLDIVDVLYLIYKHEGQHQQALRFHEELNTLRENNEKDMKQKQIDALRFAYENEKQRTNINLLTKSVEQRNSERNRLIIILLFLVCLGAVILYNNHLLHRKNVQIEEQKNQINAVREKLATSNVQLTTLNNTLEERVRYRTKELTEANEELIRVNHEIKLAFYNGQSLERKRVASELHDNLGSTLSGLKWQLESLSGDSFSLQERRIYERVLLKMEEAYSEVRLISHNLLPMELETQGLSAALQRLVEDLNQTKRVLFSYETNYQNGFFDKKAEMELYSICLELVSNILKHAQATNATIKLQQTQTVTMLSVIDNGVGIRDKFIQEGKGMGLKNLQNRTHSLNGRLDVRPAIPHGTEVQITIIIDRVA